MNHTLLAALLPLLLAAPSGRAQDSKPDDTVPASTNVQGAQYPRIHPDLRVSFRIKAPDAQKVVFGFFDSQRYPAKKGEDGFWTATSEPQVPGFHYYRVFIDGAEVNDPGSHAFYGTGTLPASTGLLVSVGGGPVDLVLGSDPEVEFMQIDAEGMYRFRTLERFALRVKDATAVMRLEFAA